MKNKKNYVGFHIAKNMANFEAFRYGISSSINLLFLKSDILMLGSWARQKLFSYVDKLYYRMSTKSRPKKVLRKL